jgi:hypothetical protein
MATTSTMICAARQGCPTRLLRTMDAIDCRRGGLPGPPQWSPK